LYALCRVPYGHRVAMRIGELARRTGVEAGTLRAWERRFGLLEPARTKGGQRQYSDADLDRVLSVRRLIDEGLTLSAAVERVLGAGDGVLPPGEAETLMLRRIVENLSVGIVVAKDGRTLYANRRMAEMLRCTVQEMLATSLLAFIAEKDLPLAKARMADLRRGVDAVYERRLRRADGTSFDAETHVRPLFDRAGRYEGSVAIMSDITDRKAAEAEHRFRAALLDAVGEAVTASNNEGIITYANNAAVALTGWPVEEFVGRHIDSFPTASPQTHEELEEIRARVQAGERFSGAVPVVRRDGSMSSCQLTSTPVFDTGGERVGRINVMHDVTERQHIDRELHTRDLRASAVAVLGARAISRGRDSASSDDVLLRDAVEATCRLLDADRAGYLEVNEDGSLSPRASVSEVFYPSLPGGTGSLGGFTVLARTVIVVDDIALERRFNVGAFSPGTHSAISAPVFGPFGVRGVLSAGRGPAGSFDDAAADFVQAMANVIGTALK
jgi:PAS domain S-box-containing protein